MVVGAKTEIQRGLRVRRNTIITKEKRKGGREEEGDVAKKDAEEGRVVLVIVVRYFQGYRGWTTRHVTRTQRNTFQKD